MLDSELTSAPPHAMRLQPFLEQSCNGSGGIGAFVARKAFPDGIGRALNQHANHRIGIGVLIQSGTDRGTERLQGTAAAAIAVVETIHPVSIDRPCAPGYPQ